MSKYRFKTKEEFIRDGLRNDKYDCPDEWAWDGQMNKYLGMDVPDEISTYCNKKEDFEYDGWLFQNTDYVLKEQQEYFNDLSQHIGRYIRALVDNPHSGSEVKEGDIGKIINRDQADFPNHKGYYCTEALREDYLGTRYELLPEDYSPEQEVKEPNIEFIPGKWYKYNKWYIKYKEHVDDVWRSSEEIDSCKEYRKRESKFGDRDSDDKKILLLDLSEIQEYLPEGHPDKIINQKFEIGKWYKWYQKDHANYHYGKVKEINLETDTLVMNPWIIQCDEYIGSGTFNLSKAEQIQEISIEEIQEFLPDGHPDKITSDEFKKGEYIVITDKFDSWAKDFVSNHIYKQRKDSTYLQPEYDSLNSITNGWLKYTINNSHNWRYATQEEIDEYEKRGKPYDVTELQKKELSMEEIQEECKKRFPIGCTYISTSEAEHVLKDDSCTYIIVGKQIWAHSEGGLLYADGKYATLVSLPEENITEVPEYIECTKTQEYYFIKGNVYKVIDSSSLTSARLVSNIELSQIPAGTQLFCLMEINGKKYWKPSTKEAYEQQKPLTYESVSGCFPTDKNTFIYDEIGQYPLTPSECWKNIPKFEEQKEFDIYGPTPDIE